MAKVIEHLPQGRMGAVGQGRRIPVTSRPQPVLTLSVLAREELREIVRRLALGDRPGTALEPVSTKR